MQLTAEHIIIYQDKTLLSGKYGTEDGGEECDGDDDGFRNPVKSEIACEAYSLTAYSNPLNPDSFPGIRNGQLFHYSKRLSL